MRRTFIALVLANSLLLLTGKSCKEQQSAAPPPRQTQQQAAAQSMPDQAPVNCTKAPNHFYIAPSGSDSNDGSTPCTPWASIQHADTLVGPGATVHVAPGTYYLTSGVTTTANGTATAPITWLSDTGWGAKLVANSALDACWTNTGNSVVIQGFEITESDSGSCRIGLLNQGSNVRIYSNRVHDLTKADAIVRCDGDQGGGGAGIDSYSSTASGADIASNVVFHIGDYTSRSCRFIQGIYTAMNNVRVMNNLIYENMSFGINMGANSNSNVIASNTVFANGYGGLFIDNASTNAVVSNNLFFNNNGQGINCYSLGPVTIANNLIYGQTSPFLNNGNCSQGATIAAAPAFVNYKPDGTGDYHLRPGSPGSRAGISIGSPPVDFAGNLRPANSFDIGAFQLGASPSAASAGPSSPAANTRPTVPSNKPKSSSTN